jgi:hypothetical protein
MITPPLIEDASARRNAAGRKRFKIINVLRPGHEQQVNCNHHVLERLLKRIIIILVFAPFVVFAPFLFRKLLCNREASTFLTHRRLLRTFNVEKADLAEIEVTVSQ